MIYSLLKEVEWASINSILFKDIFLLRNNQKIYFITLLNPFADN